MRITSAFERRLTQIKNRALLIVIIIISLLSVSLYFYFTNIIQEDMEKVVAEKREMIERIYREDVEHLKRLYGERLDNMLQAEGVLEAFAAHDRKTLFSIARAYYDGFLRENPHVGIMTFRLPDGSAFLRVHKPEFFGDALNEKRRIIKETNRLKQRLYGFEVGKLKMTYRITTPLFIKGHYIGMVELGIDPNYFTKNFKEVISLHSALLVKYEDISVLQDQSRVIKGNRYVLQTDDALFKERFDKLDFSLEQLILDAHGKKHRVEQFSLNDYEGRPAAKILVAFDISHAEKRHNTLFNNLFMGSLAVIGIVFAVLHYIFHFFLDMIRQTIHTDELTQLPNRKALIRDLSALSTVRAVLVNIESFKHVNEIFGIQTGNLVLQHYAMILKSYGVAHGFRAYRTSADEFVLVKEASVAGPGDDDERFARELIRRSRQPIVLDSDNRQISIDVTVGIAVHQDDVLQKADMALKEARKHKLEYSVYEPGIDTTDKSAEYLSILNRVKQAIADDRIVPFYQPILDAEGNVSKYECLMRMIEEHDGKRVAVVPYYFLDIVMKTHFYHTLTRRMVEKSLATACESRAMFSLNLSMTDIDNRDFLDFFKEKLTGSGCAERIIIEITESENMNDEALILAFIEEFRQLGVKFAIDDFGSGYSNFAYIMKMRPDYLKIDGSLIKDIHTNQVNYAIVKTIVAFSRELGIKTIAEYIHSHEVFDIVKKLGVDEYQGFHFHEPEAYILP